MADNTARVRLESLRDEIARGYAFSPATEIRYATLIVAGKQLGSNELVERWEQFTKSIRFRPPLSGGHGSFRRDVRWNIVDTCLFGDVGKVELDRFKQQACAARAAILDYLTVQGRDFGPIPDSLKGLAYLLYCAAWDFGDQINYIIENFDFYSDVSELGSSPFASRETFESWEVGKLELQRGHYFATLSMDLRSCTLNAIDTLLSGQQIASVKRKQRTTVKDKSTEDRDRWIYEKCCEAISYKSMIIDLK